MKVYLLNHLREDEGCDEFKLIGIFSTQDKAEEAKKQLLDKPGFRDYPSCFYIDPYEIDKMFWVDGFG